MMDYNEQDKNEITNSEAEVKTEFQENFVTYDTNKDAMPNQEIFVQRSLVIPRLYNDSEKVSEDSCNRDFQPSIGLNQIYSSLCNAEDCRVWKDVSAVNCDQIPMKCEEPDPVEYNLDKSDLPFVKEEDHIKNSASLVNTDVNRFLETKLDSSLDDIMDDSSRKVVKTNHKKEKRRKHVISNNGKLINVLKDNSKPSKLFLQELSIFSKPDVNRTKTLRSSRNCKASNSPTKLATIIASTTKKSNSRKSKKNTSKKVTNLRMCLPHSPREPIYPTERKIRNYLCDKCGKSFISRSVLTNHICEGITPDLLKIKPYSCNRCKEKFNLRSDLSNHFCHEESKPFSCRFCDRTFGFKAVLNGHLRTHTGERPFGCSFCDMKFVWKKDLETHVLKHNGDRPWACMFCDSRFLRKGDLMVHRMLHDGEKTVKCEYCEKPFYRKSDLNKHIVMHTGERRYSCPNCERKFYWRKDLLRHILTHNGTKPFPCSFCNKCYSRKAGLNKHMSTHTSFGIEKCKVSM